MAKFLSVDEQATLIELEINEFYTAYDAYTDDQEFSVLFDTYIAGRETISSQSITNVGGIDTMLRSYDNSVLPYINTDNIFVTSELREYAEDLQSEIEELLAEQQALNAIIQQQVMGFSGTQNSEDLTVQEVEDIYARGDLNDQFLREVLDRASVFSEATGEKLDLSVSAQAVMDGYNTVTVVAMSSKGTTVEVVDHTAYEEAQPAIGGIAKASL